MPNLIRYVNECERIPTGWGLAWRDWTCQRAAVMPIPLNLLAWVGIAAYRWLTMLPPTRLERAMSEQYSAGRRRGYHEGHQAAMALLLEMTELHRVADLMRADEHGPVMSPSVKSPPARREMT